MRKSLKFNSIKIIYWLKTSLYAFPVLLIVLLALLTLFKINGSSAGMYHVLTYGSTQQDPDLIYGKPRPIRSDEWLGTVPIIESQYKTGFPQFNNDIGSGKDVALVPDAPTKNWLTLFRPQNWAYFILPFENAFAFKWWLPLVLLITSVYFFVLRVLGKNKKLAILLSLAFSLSPFLWWWYLSSLLVPLAYGFLMMILSIRIIDQERIRHFKNIRLANFLYVFALAYLGASLVLFIYAPFIISIFIVVVTFTIGYLLNRVLSERSISYRQMLVRIGIMVSPLIIIGPIVFLFVTQHRDMIHAISNSIYPGHRVVNSGELLFRPIYRFFDSFLMPLLPQPPTGRFYTNQSEASNFILLLPFLLIPGIIIQVYEYLKNRKIDWVFALIQLMSILLMVRITIPVANGFYKLLLLNRVPNNRLLVAVGFLGFLQLLYLIKNLDKIKMPKRIWTLIVLSVSFATLLWLLVFSKYIFHEYLMFKNKYLVVSLLSLFFTAIITAFLFRKKLIGATLLLAFTVLSTYKIMPLEIGVPFLEHSAIINKIERISKPTDSWAVVDNFTFNNLPLAAGRKDVNSSQLYSDISFWRNIDKDGHLEYVYNREAHVIFVTNTAEPSVFLPKTFSTIKDDIELEKGNVFKVKFSCNDFVYKNVDYVLTTHELGLHCVTPIDKVSYPKVSFYIYKVQPVK